MFFNVLKYLILYIIFMCFEKGDLKIKKVLNFINWYIYLGLYVLIYVYMFIFMYIFSVLFVFFFLDINFEYFLIF